MDTKLLFKLHSSSISKYYKSVGSALRPLINRCVKKKACENNDCQVRYPSLFSMLIS